jgi:hypothetical protein
MPVNEVHGYQVGQRGRIEVLNSAGNRRFWVEGEIVRLLPMREGGTYALIKTPAGTGVYRVL